MLNTWVAGLLPLFVLSDHYIWSGGCLYMRKIDVTPSTTDETVKKKKKKPNESVTTGQNLIVTECPSMIDNLI